MAVKREIARVTDDAVWDAFVESSPQGSVFSTSAWMRAAAEAQGGEPVMLGVFENGRLSGGCAFLEIKRGPFRKATAPVLAPYCGFLFAPFSGTRPSEEESRNAVCAGALIEFLQKRYHHVLLIHDPRYLDMREFLWRGFSCQVKYTYILDLADPDKLWNELEDHKRRCIRKADTTLSIEETKDSLLFREMYSRLYRDRGIRMPVPKLLAGEIVDRMCARGIAKVNVVRDQKDELVVLKAVTFDNKTVYDFVDGAIPSRNNSGASTMLLWDVIRRHTGVHDRFDLVGANMRSIAFFKKGFGGVLTPYFVTEWYSSPLTRAAFTAYAGIRKVFR